MTNKEHTAVKSVIKMNGKTTNLKLIPNEAQLKLIEIGKEKD